MATDFALALRRFLTSYPAGLRGCSPSTIASYRDTFKPLIAWFRDERSVPPARLTLDHLDAGAITAFLSHLQGTAKTTEGTRHPDRDAQFAHLNATATAFLDAGEPVISVDAKAKEWLGNRDRPGRTWRPGKDPIKVDCHTLVTSDHPVVIPYGIYDLATNSGWVNVGTDHDTAEFAVESIRRWWRRRGCLDHPHATRLLIAADAGGSNNPRYRTWKKRLHDFARESGLEITVCPFPPGTSKWNKIEHRMFCHITANWRGRPLTSYQVVIETIAATTTETELKEFQPSAPGQVRTPASRHPSAPPRTDPHHLTRCWPALVSAVVRIPCSRASASRW